MAQHDMNIANQGFPAFRADLNSALTAIANNSSGATEPSTTFAYQWWYDTSANALKMRNADNDAWIEIGTFNQTTDSFAPSGVTSDKISEGNSSIEIVDTGTGYAAVVIDGVETARFASGVQTIKNSSGSSVGKIGTAEGRANFVDDTFGGLSPNSISNAIVPVNNSGNATNNLVDLGTSSYNFKDAYLSGGVYLGGTGAVNHLDDYEEGTFTPTIADGATGGTYSIQKGRYTKIGRAVYYSIDLNLGGWTANTNHLTVGGLPFLSIASSPMGGAFINYQSQFLSSASLADTTLHQQTGTANVYFYTSSGASFIGTYANNINTRIIILGFYETT